MPACNKTSKHPLEIVVNSNSSSSLAETTRFSSKRYSISHLLSFPSPPPLFFFHLSCSDVYVFKADIVSPCAVGGILNPQTIPHIKAPIICGAANNQLADLAKDDQLIHERSIVYIPDFLVNRMGMLQTKPNQTKPKHQEYSTTTK